MFSLRKYYNIHTMRYEVEGLILAGGLGRRMGSITHEQQKCLLLIEGKPIIGYILENLVSAFGSIDLKISVGFKGDDVKEWINANKPKKVKITYVADKITSAGIRAAYFGMEPFLRSPFISLTSDVLAFPEAYQNTYELFIHSQSDLSLSLSPKVTQTDSHGVGKLDGLQITEYSYPPPKDLKPEHLRDMSIYATDKRLFKMFRKYPDSETTNVSSLVAKITKEREYNITGFCHEYPWTHISYPEDLERISKWVQLREAHNLKVCPP